MIAHIVNRVPAMIAQCAGGEPGRYTGRIGLRQRAAAELRR